MFDMFSRFVFFFFFNDTATTEIYTLSLHDALPIAGSGCGPVDATRAPGPGRRRRTGARWSAGPRPRSEEHTSELQSHVNLVCRLLLEKKKNENLDIKETTDGATSTA